MKRRPRRSPFRSSTQCATMLCSVALLQSLAVPLLAQGAMEQGTASELTVALNGSGVPQTVKVKELDNTWRRFQPNVEQAGLLSALSHMRGAEPSPYFTRGETVRAGRETYLVAYRQIPEQPTGDAMARRQAAMMDDDGDGVPNSMEEAVTKLRPDAVLTLSLLNLRTLGNLDNIRTFSPAKDVLTAAEIEKKASVSDTEGSVSNLKQIGLGMMQYIQDYDEMYPPMRSAQSQAEIDRPAGRLITVQQALQPYVRNTRIFSHPTTRQLYRPNLALSGVNQASLKDIARTVAFWEQKPARDGRRAVLYADGHVRRERESDWPQIMARSNRLLPPRSFRPITKPKPRPAKRPPNRR